VQCDIEDSDTEDCGTEDCDTEDILRERISRCLKWVVLWFHQLRISSQA